MKLAVNVKVKTGILEMVPWISNNTAQAIYPNIYLPKKVFENLKSLKPNPKYIDVLLHEEAHIKRQREMGLLRWGMKYVFSPRFRFNEEIFAIKAQKNVNVEKSARQLSSWVYLWMVSYEEAKNVLKIIMH